MGAESGRKETVESSGLVKIIFLVGFGGFGGALLWNGGLCQRRSPHT